MAMVSGLAKYLQDSSVQTRQSPMPRTYQRLFDPAALIPILLQTGRAIELSPDDQSDYLSILSPATSLPQPLTTVMAMQSDVPTLCIDTHGRGDASQGAALLRFLISRQPVNQGSQRIRFACSRLRKRKS